MTKIVRVMVLVSIVFGFHAPASAQEKEKDGYRVSAVMFGSGENPIASGFMLAVDLTNENGGFIEVTAQQEQAWFMMGHDWKVGKAKASFYGSVGHLQGAPWVGPYVSISLPITKIGGQDVSVGVLTWPGFFLGREPASHRDDGKVNPESLLVGYFSIASLNVGGVGLQLSHLNFLDDPTNWLTGVSYTHKLRVDLEATGSATWNKNAQRFMYFIGATWHPVK